MKKRMLRMAQLVVGHRFNTNQFLTKKAFSKLHYKWNYKKCLFQSYLGIGSHFTHPSPYATVAITTPMLKKKKKTVLIIPRIKTPNFYEHLWSFLFNFFIFIFRALQFESWVLDWVSYVGIGLVLTQTIFGSYNETPLSPDGPYGTQSWGKRGTHGP